MNSVTITLPECRTDTTDFFKLSGYYGSVKRWSRYPLLAFVATEAAVAVQILSSQSEVKQSALPDSTPCLQQWGGEWRSDFFRFTLGDARAALGLP